MRLITPGSQTVSTACASLKTERAPQQRAIALRFDLLAQHFFNLFRVIGLQARDHQHQTIVILPLQAVEDDLLRGVVIVTLN